MSNSEPSFNIHDFTRVKNAALLLMTLEEKGSGTKTRTTLRTFNTSARRYSHIIEDLIEINAIQKTQLNGDRTWISITDKGRRIVRKWRQFIKSFNGGT